MIAWSPTFAGLVLVVIVVVAAVLHRPTANKVARDMGLSGERRALTRTWRWQGREVMLEVVPCLVQISAAAPAHLRVQHRSHSRIYLTGPPEVELPGTPATLMTCCDDLQFAQRVFSDPKVMEVIQAHIRRDGDELDVRPNLVQVERNSTAFEGEYAALCSAFLFATAIVTNLGLGISGDGSLPVVQVGDVSVVPGD